MEGRVRALEEKMEEINENQLGFVTKVEAGFKEAKGMFVVVNEQMSLVLLHLDVLMGDRGSTSSERTMSKKGKKPMGSMLDD